MLKYNNYRLKKRLKVFTALIERAEKIWHDNPEKIWFDDPEIIRNDKKVNYPDYLTD